VIKNEQLLGQKIRVETYNRLPKAWEEKLENFFGKLKHSIAVVYTGGI
jgi:hypothetical protein